MSRLAIAADVASVADADRSYAVRLPDGPVIVFDGTGSVIWELLREDADPVTLTVRLSQRVIDPPADIDDTVAAFIATLQAHGLIIEAD